VCRNATAHRDSSIVQQEGTIPTNPASRIGLEAGMRRIKRACITMGTHGPFSQSLQAAEMD